MDHVKLVDKANNKKYFGTTFMVQLCHPFMCALLCYFKVYRYYSYADILLITKLMGHVLKMCSVSVSNNDDKYARYLVTSRQYQGCSIVICSLGC